MRWTSDSQSFPPSTVRETSVIIVKKTDAAAAISPTRWLDRILQSSIRRMRTTPIPLAKQLWSPGQSPFRKACQRDEETIRTGVI